MKILSNILVKAGVIVDNYVAIGTNSPYAGYNIDSRGSHNFGTTSTEVYHYFQSSNVSGGSALTVSANNTSANSGRSQIMVSDTNSSVLSRFGIGVYTGTGMYAYLDSASLLVMNANSGANVSIGGIVDTGYKLNIEGSVRIKAPSDGQILFGSQGNSYPGISLNGTLDSSNYNFTSNNVDKTLYINSPSGYGIKFRQNNSDRMVLADNGVLSVVSLAGTGSRMVVADSSGALSTQSLPNLSGYVPYTGATSSVVLGTNNSLTAHSLFTTATAEGGLFLTQNSAITGSESSTTYSSIKAFTNRYLLFSFGQPTALKRFRFDVNGLTDNTTLTYTMPNANGTIALTSDIPSLANYVTTNTTQTISAQKTFYSGTTIFDSNQPSTLIEGRAGGTLYAGMFFGPFFQFNAYPAATAGYLWKNGAGNNVMALEQSGAFTLSSLAGTGTRMVVVNSSGVLSTQSISSSTNAFQEYTYTATANQTTFSATYTVGQVAVFYNGSKLEPAEYTANDGTSVVLGFSCVSGDIIDILAYQTGAGIGLTALSATGPLTYNNTTGTFAIQKADSLKDGYLSSTDWTTFNSKQNALTNPVTGTGTTNYLPKFTGSTTIGNSVIYDDGTNIGIGTTTPSSIITGAKVLQVTGSSYGFVLATSGTVTAQMIGDAGGNVAFGSRSNHSMTLTTNDVERMRINTSGNVLIGGSTSTNSAAILQVFGSTQVSTNNGQIRINDSVTTTKTMSLGVDGTNNVGFIQSFQDGVAYRSLILNGLGGNVGIGVSAPTGRFHIVSDNTPSISGTSPTGAFVIQSTATTALTMGVNPNGPFNGWIQMRHGALADIAYGLMLQPLGGTVVIGTSSGNSSGATLQVEGTGAFGPLSLRFANAASGRLWKVGPDGANNFVIYNENNTGAYINYSATSWTGNSDIRLKNIINPITDAVSKLAILNPIIFSWKSDETNKENLGLIAQDVEKVFPQVIDINSQGMLGVRYTELIPVLVKAIQEQQEEINSLKSQLGSN